MKKIAVIDYGMGNLRSVAKALEHAAGKSARVTVTSSHKEVTQADHVVFPGQGAARDCMHQLEHHSLLEVVNEAWLSKPFLGICMGLQVLFDFSEENGGTACLGLIPGHVEAFGCNMRNSHTGTSLKVPHMGWNLVKQQQPHPLWQGIDDGARFYFVHSYYAASKSNDVVCGVTEYGISFTSAIAINNAFACQFHPEKSSKDGLRLLKNFIDWDGGL